MPACLPGGRCVERACAVSCGVMLSAIESVDEVSCDPDEVVSEPDANHRVVPATPGLSNLRNDAKRLRLSECAPLFLSAYHMRNAGAIIHSHAMCTVVATMLHEDNGSPGAPYDEFRCTELEMIKGEGVVESIYEMHDNEQRASLLQELNSAAERGGGGRFC